jgi:AraC-like DNA-binding protein
MRFTEFKTTNEALGPSGAVPGAPRLKDKIAAGGDKNNPLFSQDTLNLQKELKAAGADLGTFGPDKDGLDGVMGAYTRRAAAKFPEIAKKFKDVLDKPNPSSKNIDTGAIQDPDFNKKLEKVAGALGVSSKDLMAIFKQESGVNPAAVNATSGATGLIQFMPDTASRLGTSTSELKSMTAVEQLDYVYKYFKMVGVKPGMGLGDLYMAVFMPKYVGADDSTVLGQEGAKGFSGKVYAQNKGLDKNKDGSITVADVKSSVQRFA